MRRTRFERRGVVRAPRTYRDDRVFLIACDDTYVPKQYFKLFELPRVKVLVVETRDGTSAAKHVLTRLLEIPPDSDDERWLLLDTDHYIEDSHQRGFQQAITAAKRAGVQVAISRPCFELWLLLRHVPSGGVVGLADAASVLRDLRSVLGAFAKNNLRVEDFPLESIASAIKRARELDAAVGGGDIPERNATRVYKLCESILRYSPSSTLPSALRDAIGPELAPTRPARSVPARD